MLPTELRPTLAVLGKINRQDQHAYTAREMQVLLTLGRDHPAASSTSALAQDIGISKPATTRAIAALAHQGLLTNRIAPRDRRLNVVALTEAGLAMIQQLGWAARTAA